MDISNKRQQALLLHLVSYEDMSPSKWASKLKKQHEIEWLRDKPHTQWSQLSHVRTEILQELDKLLSVEVADSTEAPVMQSETLKVETQGIVVSKGSVANTSVTQPLKLCTDKGEMYSVSGLRDSLIATYQVADIDTVFDNAKDAAKIDKDWSYISANKKKSLISQMKKAVKKLLDKSLDEL